MRHFRLYVGERSHLSGAGCLVTLLSVAVTLAVGYTTAVRLADHIGPGRWMIAIVAASGLATWVAGYGLCRRLGRPLIVEKREE